MTDSRRSTWFGDRRGLLADPLLADPLLASPLLASPLLADPLLADPLLARVAESVHLLPEAKTTDYAAFGAPGMLTVFAKGAAVLLNGVHRRGHAACSSSMIGRIAAAWMPVVVFSAQKFEHTVLNISSFRRL